MWRGFLPGLAVVSAAILATAPVRAAEAEEEIGVGRHSPHAHHVSVFGGGTYNIDKEEAHGTLGADYMYHLPWLDGWFGLGVFGEAIFAEHVEGLMGFPIYLYLTHELWVQVGPGFELVQEEEESGGGEEEPEAGREATRTEAEFLLRFGLGYNIEVGHGFSLTPSVDVDLVRSNRAVVFGVAIGRSF